MTRTKQDGRGKTARQKQSRSKAEAKQHDSGKVSNIRAKPCHRGKAACQSNMTVVKQYDGGKTAYIVPRHHENGM